MPGDGLAALGQALRADADAWLAGLLAGWSLPGADAAAEPLAELARLEREVAALSGQTAALDELRSTLTAGFPGAPSPVSTDDAVDEDAAVRAESARPIAPSAPPEARISSADRGSADRLEKTSSGEKRAVDPERAKARPTFGGGIRGLGDLAALAGTGGLDLDGGQWAGSVDSPRQDHEDRSADDAPSSRTESPRRDADLPSLPVDPGARDQHRPASGADARTFAPQSIRLPIDHASSDVSADRSESPDDAVGQAEAVDGRNRDSVDLPRAHSSVSQADSPDPPRPIRLPARDRRDAGRAADQTRGADHGFAVDGAGRSAEDARWSPASPEAAGRGRFDGWLQPGPITLPFVEPPSEPVENRRSSDVRAPADAAAPRDFGGFSGDAGARGTAAGDLHLPMTRRIRPAAEILGTAETQRPAPNPPERAESPAPAPTEHPSESERMREPVIVREMEAPGPLPEPPGWADLDVQDLMDALAREIMHEYRRHYGGA